MKNVFVERISLYVADQFICSKSFQEDHIFSTDKKLNGFVVCIYYNLQPLTDRGPKLGFLLFVLTG